MHSFFFFLEFGKNQLITMVTALIVPNRYINYDELSILVTGPSMDSFKLKLGETGIHEKADPFGKY